MVGYSFIAWVVNGHAMMDRMAMVPSFKKLSLVENTDTEQVISGAGATQEKFSFLWETATDNVQS